MRVLYLALSVFLSFYYQNFPLIMGAMQFELGELEEYHEVGKFWVIALLVKCIFVT